MNELQLRRLLRRVLLSAPLPLAMLGAACGGSSLIESNTGGSAGSGESPRAGSSGAPSAGGSSGAPSAGGSSGGTSSNAGAPAAGAPAGGATMGVAGAGGAGAGGAGAAAGQAGAGAGGAAAGQAGAGAGGAEAGQGTGGAGAAGGSAGAAGSAGFAGVPNDECRGSARQGCGFFFVTVPNSCNPELTSTYALPHTLSQATCSSICNASILFNCSLAEVTASDATVWCNSACAGRRPQGMLETGERESNEAGSYFAQVAQLEAASVIAFRVLRDELRAAGAPQALVRAAARAARDEIRHARATGALARRFGGKARSVTVTRGARRSLEAIALENAVEGCVRETYGALLATRQAHLARDPVVRAAMTRIARDETRHASLSWRVGRWLETRLDPAARRNVELAKSRAAQELRLAVVNEPACPFAELAGLPSPAESAQLVADMTRLLWS